MKTQLQSTLQRINEIKELVKEKQVPYLNDVQEYLQVILKQKRRHLLELQDEYQRIGDGGDEYFVIDSTPNGE